MKIGIVKLPYEKVVPRVSTIGDFHNLHGIWKPPAYVKEFWASGAAIEYVDDADYETKTLEVLESYEAAAKRHDRWHPSGA